MRWLLRLYPRAWRQRYGAEPEEVVAAQPKSLQLFVDLLGGAVDAHGDPKLLADRLEAATDDRRGGWDMLTRLTRCGTAPVASRKDALFAAGLTIGSALVVAAIMLLGRSPVTETIGLVMFPGVLAVGAQSMQLRRHSLPAKVA